MRLLDESRVRWQETVKHSASFADLQRAVKFNGPESPCISGCRSVCWKAFLLFQNAPAANWSHILLEARNAYSSLRDRHLLYVKHPEKLAELSLDPLADVPESPWDAFRQDELVRAEILQDVRRLPDEPSFYHEQATQTLILDVLFLYCKTHPDAGGYRQGMHELLAPIVHVVHLDALDRASAVDGLADPAMIEMLDSYFVEHDSYALFSAVMERAGAFYEISSAVPATATAASAATTTTASALTTTGPFGSSAAGSGISGEQSAIVEKSRQIHEVTLMRVDPELANHLKTIEILPQIFLIRWIRLLFGREFPFEQQLVLWDTIFAFDPTLELIDLVCVAMLIRIRWTLLESDYSSALQTLLKYPPPQPPHGPHTFVDDAVYLKDHLNPAGGSALVLKYTGRAPVPAPLSSSTNTPVAGGGGGGSNGSSRPSTPISGFASLRQARTTLGVRSSPLSASSSSAAARFIQQQASVEALFQGAAKGFMERGERLGLNQAVRDAVGEIRRNVQQGLQEARRAAAAPPSSSPRAGAGGSGLGISNGVDTTVEALARRNRQLAAMLDETVASLRSLAAQSQSDGFAEDDGARAAHRDGIEMAAARVQFVQVYLEDSTLLLPEEDQQDQQQHPPRPSSATAAVVGGVGSSSNGGSGRERLSASTVALDTTPVVASTAAVLDAVRDDLRSPLPVSGSGRGSSSSGNHKASSSMSRLATPVVIPSPDPNVLPEEPEEQDPDRMDTDVPAPAPLPPPSAAAPSAAPEPPLSPAPTIVARPKERPKAPIPTRSTIAQSSFSWMLEPDTSPSSAAAAAAAAAAASAAGGGSSRSALSLSRGGGGGGGSPFSTSSSAPPHLHQKRQSASRERNAFLFGEVLPSDGNGGPEGRRRPLTSDEIFGLEPLRKSLPRAGSP